MVINKYSDFSCDKQSLLKKTILFVPYLLSSMLCCQSGHLSVVFMPRLYQTTILCRVCSSYHKVWKLSPGYSKGLYSVMKENCKCFWLTLNMYNKINTQLISKHFSTLSQSGQPFWLGLYFLHLQCYNYVALRDFHLSYNNVS